MAGSVEGGLWVTVAPHGADTTEAVAYWSPDSGRTWLPRDGGLSALASYHGLALCIALDPTNPGILHLGQGFQIARSADRGTTWDYSFGTTTDRGAGINGIAAAADGLHVYAGGQDAIGNAMFLRSEDRGLSWTLVDPHPAAGDAVTSVAVVSGGIVIVGMRSAVWLTRDAGTTWSQVLRTRRDGWVRAIVRARSGFVALADEEVTVGGRPASSLGAYWSADGETWSVAPTPDGAMGATAAALTPSGSVLVGTNAGVWLLAL